MKNKTQKPLYLSYESSIARSQVYRLLAAGFSYPSYETYERLSNNEYAKDMFSALSACSSTLFGEDELDFLSEFSIKQPFESWEAAYLSAFEMDMPTPSVSLYEGSYVQKNNRPGLLLEVKAFYRNFGLEIANEVNDLEDTLTAELEFMHFLTAKQAHAEENNSDSQPYRLAQYDFIDRHLAIWVPSFNEAVMSTVKEPFFVSLASLTCKFVSAEHKKSLILSEM